MRLRRRLVLSLVDEALSRVDEKVLRRLSRGYLRLRDDWRRAPRARGSAVAGPFAHRAPGSEPAAPMRRVRPATVLTVLVLAGSVALAVATLVPSEPARPGGTSPAWIGVHDGDSIPAYLERSRARLEALAARDANHVGYALASFRSYLTPDGVAVVLAETDAVAGVTAYARAPLPGRQTERVSLSAIRVPADLVAAMARVADRKEQDAARYAALAQGEPEGTLRRIYASQAEVARAEAQAYRQGCACVFALVVRGPAAALVELATSPEVRVVDPATGVSDPGQAVFVPPLPEQVDRVTPPADDAMPPPT
jgi:hypothetical protein